MCNKIHEQALVDLSQIQWANSSYEIKNLISIIFFYFQNWNYDKKNYLDGGESHRKAESTLHIVKGQEISEQMLLHISA